MTEEDQKRFWFNVIAEAKMKAYVMMAKTNLPPDQVRQFCEEMLARALKEKGVS